MERNFRKAIFQLYDTHISFHFMGQFAKEMQIGGGVALAIVLS